MGRGGRACRGLRGGDREVRGESVSDHKRDPREHVLLFGMAFNRLLLCRAPCLFIAKFANALWFYSSTTVLLFDIVRAPRNWGLFTNDVSLNFVIFDLATVKTYITEIT